MAALDRDFTPIDDLRALNDAVAALFGQEGFADNVYAALEAYWRGDGETVAILAEQAGDDGSGDRLIGESRRELNRMGHYNSAMLHYGGEWYWGIDRLHYLERRLADLERQLARSDATTTPDADYGETNLSIPIATATEKVPPASASSARSMMA